MSLELSSFMEIYLQMFLGDLVFMGPVVLHSFEVPVDNLVPRSTHCLCLHRHQAFASEWPATSCTLQQFGAPLCLLSWYLGRVGSRAKQFPQYNHRETVIAISKQTRPCPKLHWEHFIFSLPDLCLYFYDEDSNSSFLEH